MNLAPDNTIGFTGADLMEIARAHTANRAKSLWGSAYFIGEREVEHVAIWGPHAAASHPPMLTISRFKRSGTYAAVSGSHLLATGRTLGEILRALGAFGRGHAEL